MPCMVTKCVHPCALGIYVRHRYKAQRVGEVLNIFVHAHCVRHPPSLALHVVRSKADPILQAFASKPPRQIYGIQVSVPGHNSALFAGPSLPTRKACQPKSSTRTKKCIGKYSFWWGSASSILWVKHDVCIAQSGSAYRKSSLVLRKTSQRPPWEPPVQLPSATYPRSAPPSSQVRA